MKHTLILMCGVTQSGKSVFAKTIQDSHEDCVAIKRDNCRMYNSEDADTVDKRFYNTVNIALKSHRYVVANDRNINRIERDKFFNNVNCNGCEVICVWVETPQNVAVARNKNRDKYHRLSEKEIAEMYRCKVSPQDNEPFDRIVFISEQQNYAISTNNMQILPIIDQLKAI
jgi:predicted kinase